MDRDIMREIYFKKKEEERSIARENYFRTMPSYIKASKKKQ